jgi:hypothetical protein
MSELKLDSLSISGFRAFQNLEIDKVGRVNLIVGKNNVGKTCLLEALRLYTQRGNPSVILNMLYSREEHTPYPQDQMDSEEQLKAISYIFHGWKIKRPPNIEEICIGSKHDPRSRLRIIVGWYEEDRDSDSIRIRLANGIQTSFMDDKNADDYFPGISIMFGNETILTIPLDRLFAERKIRFARWHLSIDEIPCIFVPAEGLGRVEATNLWDKIALRTGEDRVVEALRIIAPDVERINLLGYSERRSNRIPVVRIKGIEEPVPLRTLGEGMNRIFGIVLAAVNAQKGILLVDEIESGLHYSVHTELWKTLFRTAKRLNIQIFATTHSWDCIEGFQHAADEEPAADVALVRLEERKADIVPIVFDRERLSIATRQDIEVR